MQLVCRVSGVLARHLHRLRARLDRLARRARDAVIRLVAGAVAALVREALRGSLGAGLIGP